MTVASGTGDPDRLAERIGAEVLRHPAVYDLHGGSQGVIATYMPGKRLVGVRISEAGDVIEVAVVLWAGYPVPEVVDTLRTRVRELAGAVAVDLTVADLHTEPAAERPDDGR